MTAGKPYAARRRPVRPGLEAAGGEHGDCVSDGESGETGLLVLAESEPEPELRRRVSRRLLGQRLTT